MIFVSLLCLPGIIMVGVIIGSKRMGINPDNVATPMAASFGDLITLALLAGFSQWFYSFIGKQLWEPDVLAGLSGYVTHTGTVINKLFHEPEVM